MRITAPQYSLQNTVNFFYRYDKDMDVLGWGEKQKLNIYVQINSILLLLFCGTWTQPPTHLPFILFLKNRPFSYKHFIPIMFKNFKSNRVKENGAIAYVKIFSGFRGILRFFFSVEYKLETLMWAILNEYLHRFHLI